MRASVNIWPTPSNPASFVPVIIDYYPFESLESLPVIQRSEAAECTHCKKLVDKHFPRENDRFRCCWCNRSFTTDAPAANVQAEFDAFLVRGPERPERFHYNLVLAVDACAGADCMDQLLEYLKTAIKNLPEDQAFHLAIIQPNYITYVIVIDQVVVRFDTPPGPRLSAKMNLHFGKNFPYMLPLLIPFIDTIVGRKGLHSVKNLIEQLSGEEWLFSRVVLFSPRTPDRSDARNVFVDWIHPDTALDVTNPQIDGYFLSMSSSPGGIDTQLVRLMELISRNVIFNLELKASAVNCKWRSGRMHHATGTLYFRQSFDLVPKSGNSADQCLFGVEARYTAFRPRCVYEETICMTRAFRRSNDFIPVCASINPLVLVPHFAEKGHLERFIIELMTAYHQHCLLAIAGATYDLTFSTLPNLQWLLIGHFGVFERHPGSPTPGYGDWLSIFAYFCSRFSYWTGADCCIAERAYVTEEFYSLLGEPPVAVVDSFHRICVYGIEAAEEGSQLAAFIADCSEKRFPQPCVVFRPREEFTTVLSRNRDLFMRVESGLSARVDLTAFTSKPDPR
jgi:hypothetical protein